MAEAEILTEQARRDAARLLGQVSTFAKTRAAQANGKKGGRPKGLPMSAEAREKISLARRQQEAVRRANLKESESEHAKPVA